MNPYIIIPVFNEEQIIQDVIKKVKKAGYKSIIVVDDGSNDKTYQKLVDQKITLIRHVINRGKGAAIKTGIEAAKLLGAKVIITMDGDGQHNPDDIIKLYHATLQGYDVVLGCRLLSIHKMPVTNWTGNKLANIFIWFLYGIRVSDSQSGFRAYTEKAFYTIDTKNDKYEYDSEVLKEIAKHKLKFTEVPIDVFYTKYSMNKKQKQNLYNALKSLYKMLISL